jgi:hypothetical protein
MPVAMRRLRGQPAVRRWILLEQVETGLQRIGRGWCIDSGQETSTLPENTPGEAV